MAEAPKLGFAGFAAPRKGVLILFCDEKLKFGSAARKVLAPTGDLVARAAASEKFSGKSGSALELVLPEGLEVGRLVVIGVGKAADVKAKDFIRFGGMARGRVPASATEAMIFADMPSGAMRAEQAADLALGASLRGYTFDLYKTKRKEGEEKPQKSNVTIAVADAAAARKAWAE